MQPPRKPHPIEVSDEEWAFVAPCLSSLPEDAPQRRHDLREAFDALRWIARTGAPWRRLPTDLPPRPIVPSAGAALGRGRRLRGADARPLVGPGAASARPAAGGDGAPGPPHSGRSRQLRVAVGSRERVARRRSLPYGRPRAGPGGWRQVPQGAKPRVAADTLGHLLATRVTPAGARPPARGAGQGVDQGHTGERPAEDAGAHGIRLEVVKPPEAKRASCCCPPGRRRRPGVVERGFARGARFRRLARDHRRLPETLAGLHALAFAYLTVGRATAPLASGP